MFRGSGRFGFRFVCFGFWFVGLFGFWFADLGVWFAIFSFWFSVSDSRCFVSDSCIFSFWFARFLVSDSRILVSDSRVLVLWFFVSDSREVSDSSFVPEENGASLDSSWPLWTCCMQKNCSNSPAAKCSEQVPKMCSCVSFVSWLSTNSSCQTK